MEPSGGASAAHEALDAVQASLSSGGKTTRDSRGTPLLLIVGCRARGLSLEGAVLDGLVERLGLPAERVLEIGAFCDQLLADERPISLCRGMTCSLHGADRLHKELKQVLGRLGVDREFPEVFCLSQCEHGPSVMQGDRIWVTRACRVVEDGRAWRDGDSGPVPLTDTSRPVTD